MIIEYLAHSAFCFSSLEGKLLTDPYAPGMGYQMPYRSADLITVSHNHPDHNHISAVVGKARVFSQAGSFNYQGINLKGILSAHGGDRGDSPNIIFTWEMEKINIAHLGDLGVELTALQLEELLPVDILLLPVGGFYTLDPREAKELVLKIKPSLVIPMHYLTAQLNRIEFPLRKADDFAALFPKVEYLRSGMLEISKVELKEEIKILVMNNIF